MTVFGKPTIDETRHLMRTVEFRIERTEPVKNKLAPTPEGLKLIREWDAWHDRWKATRARVLPALLARKLQAPLLNDAMTVSPAEYALVEGAIGRPSETLALSPLMRRFEAATGDTIDLDGAPVPEGFDPDHAAYKAVDEKVRAAEAAARAAGNAAGAAAGDFFSSNPGLVIAGGVGAIVATVVLVKVYL